MFTTVKVRRLFAGLGMLVAAGSAAAAQAPADTAARIDSVMREVQRLGKAHGNDVWPGYRPDTFAFLFVLRNHGSFLAGWTGAPPSGFAPVPGYPTLSWREQRDLGAASTSVALAGHPAAQVV